MSCTSHGFRKAFHKLRRQDRHGAKRQKSDERSHLETPRGTIGQAQEVIEETILLIPHLVFLHSGAIHTAGNPQEVLDEFGCDRSSSAIEGGAGADGQARRPIGEQGGRQARRHKASAVNGCPSSPSDTGW